MRRIRRQPPSSRGAARTRCRAHRVDEGLYRKTRAGNSQPLDGGVESRGNRDPAISTATSARQKPLDGGGGGGPIGSAASVGWAKRRSFSSQRRLGLLGFPG